MQLCAECQSSLVHSKVPRLALANHLYRGKLPDEFSDLTWIEEMVCAKYRNTAHVTRIYQSTDPAQPRVFHGNTCAHDMNVVSTANTLPRTPADINGMLSVVFIGPGKFKPDCLGPMFRIRKNKVWRFLVWLKSNNRLYMDMELDRAVMDEYPDDGFIPDLEEGVVSDHTIDPALTFQEETAGLSEHPAENLRGSDENSEPIVLLEKMGVSDPEGVKLSGRTFTSSALKNLMPSNSDVPDLIMHRSSTAIPEYDNPNLLPGMFPTLFPLGTAGFDDRNRPASLSFHAQANALLDLPDRSFRYHHSYIFVVLNIIQRRTAHLQTSFTVRRSKFDDVAQKLTSVSPLTLQSLANHLEKEGKFETLSIDEKNAMSLLSQVNAISARIPGSQASKIYVRNEIRSYFSEFGLPHLYFTFNPSAAHSPIFQVMYGDTSVDLTSQFPYLVPSSERAQRLAKDPVAAADFFEFCVTCLFEHLFGWDYKTKQSSVDGGILGHLRSFYGTSEFTERGCLHGHFLIWLVGGMNPKDIHTKLKEDGEFKTRFFAFFEDIIYHHLPNVETSAAGKNFEPRVERPPVPPTPHSTAAREWNIFMQTEVKKLGEVLQRHTCRKVCHKYGNTDKCRFQFPHEVVDVSHFDAETNSVILKCLDSMVNYYNRYILVFCRHNHDIKCILSGKAAKAAMFYITDYITKMDIKTYKMLSLLSRAVSNMPEATDCSPKDRAKTLLHKCLAQYSRQQQIHAQQAARYLRGSDDSIKSHDTTPMMSGLLVSFVKSHYPITVSSDSSFEGDCEQLSVRIQTDYQGRLVSKNQVHDYYFRADTLVHMNFYEFARCISVEKNKSLPVNPRLGTLTRHELKPGHNLSETHTLLEHTNERRGETGTKLVPRVVGCHIPRVNTGLQWKLFVLAHFKPFGLSNTLIENDQTLEEAHSLWVYSQKSQIVMNNWEAIHECQDEHDADRLRKRAELTAESQAMTQAVHRVLPIDDDIDVVIGSSSSAKNDFKNMQMVHLLEQSKWLISTLPKSTRPLILPVSGSADHILPEPSVAMLKLWNQSIKEQECVIETTRRNAGGNTNEMLNLPVAETEVGTSVNFGVNGVSECPPTVTSKLDEFDPLISAEDVINNVGNEFNLNEKQWTAFRIISRSFVNRHIYKTDLDNDPLRMLMTGPGGTGKTHVVKAVKKVMEHYGAGHKIRFLAPTGSAAALIDGMTIHKGLGIKIKSGEKGKGNRKLGEDNEDYTVVISIQNRTRLRDEWRDVEVVLLDESSLLSCELNSEVDASLRFAKEKPDIWFGGVMIIFAGDFYQYAPVCGTPLYNPISLYTSQSNEEIGKRLGRLAWKTVNSVITLNEQQRMKSDPEYGSAVQRLRTRDCTFEDMDLFNSRVVKSALNPNGVDMGKPENFDAAAIVRTNLLRGVLNTRKAEANCAKLNTPLVMCAALDTCSSRVLNKREREMILNLDLSSSKLQRLLPGFLPVYVGMPVILRMKNLSTDLGITNGSQGVVRQLRTAICASGFTYCTSAIVEFPDSKVKLTGLPDGYFPILPITTSFTTEITNENGERVTIRITRSQLPFEPGFAVTGQSAQGKTLPSVLAGLHEGGFGAYVAASRARSRYGLCITECVTIEQLNRPVPHPLFQEIKRFETLEHNTLIRFGFLTGSLKTVFDAESDIGVPQTKITASFSFPGSNKRKRANIINKADTKSKKVKIINTSDGLDFSSPPIESLHPPTVGFRWCAADWSCAYDSAIMSIFYAYIPLNVENRKNWSSLTPLTRALGSSFE